MCNRNLYFIRDFSIDISHVNFGCLIQTAIKRHPLFIICLHFVANFRFLRFWLKNPKRMRKQYTRFVIEIYLIKTYSKTQFFYIKMSWFLISIFKYNHDHVVQLFTCKRLTKVVLFWHGNFLISWTYDYTFFSLDLRQFQILIT